MLLKHVSFDVTFNSPLATPQDMEFSKTGHTENRHTNAKYGSKLLLGKLYK